MVKFAGVLILLVVVLSIEVNALTRTKRQSIGLKQFAHRIEQTPGFKQQIDNASKKLDENQHTRAKRQFYGPYGGYAGGLYGPRMGMGLGYGPGLTPGQIIADRNIAIAQARGRQAILSSQIATNRAIQQANFNAALLGAEARSNIAAANARAMMLGK